MKGKFDAYILWPLAQRVQNWIADRSTARDFTVFTTLKDLIYPKLRVYQISLSQKTMRYVWTKHKAKSTRLWIITSNWNLMLQKGTALDHVRQWMSILGYFSMMVKLMMDHRTWKFTWNPPSKSKKQFMIILSYHCWQKLVGILVCFSEHLWQIWL